MIMIRGSTSGKKTVYKTELTSFVIQFQHMVGQINSREQTVGVTTESAWQLKHVHGVVDHKTTHYKTIIRSCAKNANLS